jgi:F-type H+-transporting ATPase subunit delta
MDTRVAKRYARALFNAAENAKVVEAVEADLDAIHGLNVNDAKFRGFFASPRISREDKIRIADKLFSDRVTALTMAMLRLMLNKRRENEFDAIREEFVRLRRERGEVLYAVVTSAVELTAQEREALLAKLASQSGKRVEADFRTDSSLMGGVKVAVGNYVLDGTVRGSLNLLRDRLKYDLLKQN